MTSFKLLFTCVDCDIVFPLHTANSKHKRISTKQSLKVLTNLLNICSQLLVMQHILFKRHSVQWWIQDFISGDTDVHYCFSTTDVHFSYCHKLASWTLLLLTGPALDDDNKCYMSTSSFDGNPQLHLPESQIWKLGFVTFHSLSPTSCFSRKKQSIFFYTT